MLSGATCRAAAIVGTPVFRIVVSSDSMKNATAISHGSNRLLATAKPGGDAGAPIGSGELGFVGLGSVGLRRGERSSSIRETSIITDARCDFTRANFLRHFHNAHTKPWRKIIRQIRAALVLGGLPIDGRARPEVCFDCTALGGLYARPACIARDLNVFRIGD